MDNRRRREVLKKRRRASSEDKHQDLVVQDTVPSPVTPFDCGHEKKG
jgi:hypothetical protein